MLRGCLKQFQSADSTDRKYVITSRGRRSGLGLKSWYRVEVIEMQGHTHTYTHTHKLAQTTKTKCVSKVMRQVVCFHGVENNMYVSMVMRTLCVPMVMRRVVCFHGEENNMCVSMVLRQVVCFHGEGPELYVSMVKRQTCMFPWLRARGLCYYGEEMEVMRRLFNSRYLKPDLQKKSKHKTSVIKKTLNPEFNEVWSVCLPACLSVCTYKVLCALWDKAVQSLLVDKRCVRHHKKPPMCHKS